MHATLSDHEAIWRDLPASLREMRTRPLMIVRLQVAPPLVIGATPQGQRRLAVVGGGMFTSALPGLSGRVHPGGNDMVTSREDGAVILDARILLETQDGDRIAMTYQGIRHGEPDLPERLARGEDVDPGSYVFRTLVRLETASAQFDWLNRVLCVGIGSLAPTGPTYSLFEIL